MGDHVKASFAILQTKDAFAAVVPFTDQFTDKFTLEGASC